MKKGADKLALSRETFRVLHELELTSIEGGEGSRMATGDYASCLVKARSDEPAETK